MAHGIACSALPKLTTVENAHNEEYCPSCGDFVDHIDASTGWCYECSGDTKSICMSCQREFTKDQPHRKLCGWCREERWLQRHADEIEAYMLAGTTFKFAKREVYHNNRPVCLSCGNPIAGAKDGANFCRRNVTCRRWHRRYRTLHEQNARKGIVDPFKMALAQVSAEIFAENYVMELGNGND